MREIALKEKELLKLKKYPLKNIVSTESYIYYYKKDKNFNNILLKKFHRTDQDIIERKERTIETIQKSALKDYEDQISSEKVEIEAEEFQKSNKPTNRFYFFRF